MTYDRSTAFILELIGTYDEVLRAWIHGDPTADRREVIERMVARHREEIEAIKLEAANERLESID